MSLEKDRYALVPTDFEGRSTFGRATIVDVQYNDMEGYLVEITEAQTNGQQIVRRQRPWTVCIRCRFIGSMGQCGRV